jgi:hypothetical protein
MSAIQQFLPSTGLMDFEPDIGRDSQASGKSNGGDNYEAMYTQLSSMIASLCTQIGNAKTHVEGGKKKDKDKGLLSLD